MSNDIDSILKGLPLPLANAIKKLNPVKIAPFSLSPEESDLMHNAHFSTMQNFDICHYIHCEHFLKLIHSQELYLTRIDQFKADQRDSLYPTANRQQDAPADIQIMRSMNTAQDREAIIKTHERARIYNYGHCWFGTGREDEKMWEDFGEDFKGVCITSSTHRLKGAVRPHKPFVHETGKITYWPDDKPIPTFNSVLPFMRKRPDFINENEVRLLVYYGRLEDVPVDDDGICLDTSHNLRVRVDLPQLITGIIIGSCADAERECAIIEACGKLNLSALVRRSKLQPLK